MHKIIVLWITILITLVIHLSVVAQTASFQPSPHIYKITATECVRAPSHRTQTGFRVKSLQGIITALHGIIGCKNITAQPGGEGVSYSNLIIAKVDINRDMVLLWSEQISNAPTVGLDTIAAPKNSDYAGVQVIGYPYGLFRQYLTADVKIIETTELGNLLPEEDIVAVGERSSPSLSIKVLNVQAPLVPGHSGAPLLTQTGRVIGVGNGGLDLGRVNMGWAIPWSTIQWKIISTKVSQTVSWADAQRVKDLEKQDPKLVFAFTEPEAVENSPTTAPTVMTPVPQPTFTKSPSEILASCPLPVGTDLLAYWTVDLGCPTEPAHITWASYTPYERGMMIWRDDTRLIYGFFNSNSWLATQDIFQEGMPDMPTSNRGEPPPGLIHPIRGTGLIWATNDTFFQNLGWVREQQRGFCAETQNFGQGFILRNSGQGSCYDNKSGQNQGSRAGESGFDFTYVKAYNSGKWYR